MMPLYETKQDLKNEQELMTKFTAFFKHKFRALKMPAKHKLDFCLVDSNSDSIIGIAEVKCREYNLKNFDTVVLGADKYLEAMMWIKNFLNNNQKKLHFLLVTSWLDGDYYYHYKQKDNLYLDFKGRTKKTRRPDDVAPCVYIPSVYFKEF